MKKTCKQLVGVRLKPSTIKKIEEIAEKNETSLSEAIRNILEEFLKQS